LICLVIFGHIIGFALYVLVLFAMDIISRHITEFDIS
jgi:hypothetical protein